jgi:hypothetical protein
MKKIIEGKCYNTETAIEIYEWWNGLSIRDFGHCYETLYRTKKGNYFLLGEGGAMSKYAEYIGMNEVCGSRKIIPLTKDEAIKWGEKKMPADDFLLEFSDCVEEA